MGGNEHNIKCPTITLQIKWLVQNPTAKKAGSIKLYFRLLGKTEHKESVIDTENTTGKSWSNMQPVYICPTVSISEHRV